MKNININEDIKEKKLLQLFYLVGFLYIFVTIIIAHLLSISDTLKSLLAQPYLVLVPFFVGESFLYLIKYVFKIYRNISSLLIIILTSWSLGVFIIINIEAILYINYMYDSTFFTYLIILLGTFPLFSIRSKEIKNLVYIKFSKVR